MKNQPPTRTTTVMLRAAPKFGRRRWHVLMPEAPIGLAALNSGANRHVFNGLALSSTLRSKWPIECEFACVAGTRIRIGMHE
jgi:hypothetical protein